MPETYQYEISYGKIAVPVYRAYAAPLTGLAPLPESNFTGRTNNLFALEVDVEVFGDNFLPAYTEGDNSNIVATDSMKNFILRQSLAYDGATLEGLLHRLGTQFLLAYAQMHTLRLSGRELAFTPAQVARVAGFGASDVLLNRSHDDYATAWIDFTRANDSVVLSNHHCGRVNMQLLKITGSAFTKFVRDGYTTLPERGDRPLFIALDVFWRYTNVADMLAAGPGYIAAEQVRDVIASVFDGFVSESIQHLVHEMGMRLLARFPQMAEVSFDAQNRTRDPVAASETDPRVRVYSDPFSAYGSIRLTMRRG